MYKKRSKAQKQRDANKASPFKKYYDRMFTNKRDTPASVAIKKRKKAFNMVETLRNYLKQAKKN